MHADAHMVVKIISPSFFWFSFPFFSRLTSLLARLSFSSFEFSLHFLVPVFVSVGLTKHEARASVFLLFVFDHTV